MPPKSYQVTMTEPRGLRRSVEVSADSAVRGRHPSALRVQEGWLDRLLANVFEIQVREAVRQTPGHRCPGEAVAGWNSQ